MICVVEIAESNSASTGHTGIHLEIASNDVVSAAEQTSNIDVEESAPSTEFAVSSSAVSDLSSCYKQGPMQPKLSQFKQTEIAKKNRSFTIQWYSRYPLIEYSVQGDAVFCFVCRHFKPKSNYADDVFIQSGCRNWKKLGDKLEKHNESISHLVAREQWSAAQKADATGNIVNKIDQQHKQDVIRNREAVVPLIRAVLFCARQSIALRGHRESKGMADGPVTNRGNFAELCKLIAMENPDAAKKLNAMPQNATYTSKDAQDDLLQAAAKVIQKEIVTAATDAEMFAVIVDEARDNGCSEQLSLCIRYVDVVSHSVQERFLGFAPLHKLSADALSSAVIHFLETVGLSIKCCVAQSYDGASVMSGISNGVQKLIRDAADNPCPYVHCHCHRLNLVLVDVCKQLDFVGNTIGLLEAIYAFQSVSTIRHRMFLDTQKEESRILAIPQQSDTRWVSKYAGVHYFCCRFTCVVSALTELSDSANKKEAVEARGLLHQITSFGVILSLVVLHDLLAITQTLSLQLQASSLDFGKCRRLIDATSKTLKEKRTDSYFSSMWSEAYKKAEEVGTEVGIPSSKAKRTVRPSKIFSDPNVIITAAASGHREESAIDGDIQAFYRRKVFALIDSLIGELDRRFTTNDALLHAVSACDPQSSSFLSAESMVFIANKYATVIKVKSDVVVLFYDCFSYQRLQSPITIMVPMH